MAVETTVAASTTAGDMGPSNMIAMAGSRAAKDAVVIGAAWPPVQPHVKSSVNAPDERRPWSFRASGAV